MTNYVVEIHVIKKKLAISPFGVGQQVEKSVTSYNKIFIYDQIYRNFIHELDTLIQGVGDVPKQQ